MCQKNEFYSAVCFTLTNNQNEEAQEFREKHSRLCDVLGPEARAFAETEEQATVEPSYKYEFIPGGLGPDVSIICRACGMVQKLHLSNKEIDML